MIETVLTNDGTNTLFSKEFNQHYHSTKDGALTESLYKHIIPALNYHKNKKVLNILDICFGLGYNTLATLYYIKKEKLSFDKINIFSPEFDLSLISSLKNFDYPEEFLSYDVIIKKISNELKYKDENISIEIFNGDARKYIKQISSKIDIVYQDAFSSDVNPLLWTKEYFADIKKLLSDDAIITTYSIATPIRLAMYENDLSIYEICDSGRNKSTIALNKKEKEKDYKFIDMDLKQQRNPLAKALKDATFK